MLTKPDRIPAGEEDHWLRFIRGEAEHLTNGWFSVKQPASADLRQGITWEEARDLERVFFSTTAPWSTETGYRHRFGTRHLTESLSNILSDLIKRRSVSLSRTLPFHRNSLVLVRRLPELEVELYNLLKETEALLGKLPNAPSDDAQGDIISLVSDFARELAQYVEGTPDENGIHQQIRPYNAEFLDTIWGTAQRFCPFECNSGEHFTHPNLMSADSPQPLISDSDVDAICVKEVMEMAEK